MALSELEQARARAPRAVVIGGPLAHLRDLLELTKARLSSLVLVTVGAGFLLAGGDDLRLLLVTVLGVGAAALGAGALNQWWEVPFDLRMERTRDRPLPAGRMAPSEALALGLLLLLGGSLAVAWIAGLFPAALTLATGAAYVLVYTPLKRRSPASFVPGALVGATPPLIGWTAATGELSAQAWVLFAILLAWQLPHVLAIDWVHRADYARGGYATFSSRDPSGATSGRLAVAGSAALLVASLAAVPVGLGGPLYAVGAIVLTCGLLALASRLATERTTQAGRRLFVGTLVHLPLLLALIVLDRLGQTT